MVEETRRYALFKNSPDPNITADEMRCFIAILLISGYNTVPDRKHYWKNELDVRNELVVQSMRRDRFLQIMKFIHLADNTKMVENDKAWKLRPFMEKIREKCLKNFVPHQNLNYDESMVKYFGKHGCKQFIRGKPIRFGYKMWSLNTSFGYLVNFDIYQGKNPRSRGRELYDAVFGACASPMIMFMEDLPKEKRELPYNLFVDNLFTGPNLLSFLRFRGYSGTGTVRENRLGKMFPLPSHKKFGSKARGEFESVIEKNDGIQYTRWMDNAVVTVGSTIFGANPTRAVTRFSKSERKKISVSQPYCLSEYNKYMGGTDLMDGNINCYRIGIRGKKW